MLIICTIIAFCICFLYNCFALIKFGIPKSLSETYYLFKQQNLGILFPITMFSMTILLAPTLLSISEFHDWQFTAFLVIGGLLFTGCVPTFRDSVLEDRVHTIGATIAAVAALLWTLLVTKIWIPALFWVILISEIACLSNTQKCRVYWLELITLLSTFSAIFITLFAPRW